MSNEFLRGHVNTMADAGSHAAGRRRRRTHSEEFKAQVVAACRPAGVSIAAVAMAHGVNANVVRRWVVEAEGRSVALSGQGAGAVAPTTFVPVTLPPAAPPADIRIELRRGTTAISVSWPCSAALRNQPRAPA